MKLERETRQPHSLYYQYDRIQAVGEGGQKMFGDGGKGEEGREAREGVAWGEEGEVIRACQGKKSMAVGPGW